MSSTYSTPSVSSTTKTPDSSVVALGASPPRPQTPLSFSEAQVASTEVSHRDNPFLRYPGLEDEDEKDTLVDEDPYDVPVAPPKLLRSLSIAHPCPDEEPDGPESDGESQESGSDTPDEWEEDFSSDEEPDVDRYFPRRT